MESNFSCVPQKKESHTGLEQHEGGKIVSEFEFLGELPFKKSL